MSFVQIYNIEAGRSQNPREKTRDRLTAALGQKPSPAVVAATEKGAIVEDVGEFIDFAPHDDTDLPDEPGTYVFYAVSDRPLYVGQAKTFDIAFAMITHPDLGSSNPLLRLPRT